MSVEHRLRIEANKDHPVVRRIAEFLGGGDEIEAMVALLKEIEEHPERGTWEERQEELSTECPSMEIWDEPQKAANEARTTIDEDFEIGAIAYMRAEAALDKAARRFQRYEERVMKGAAIAVKWLGRAKFAGKIAATALPGSAVVNAAVYSIIQEGGSRSPRSPRASGRNSTSPGSQSRRGWRARWPSSPGSRRAPSPSGSRSAWRRSSAPRPWPSMASRRWTSRATSSSWRSAQPPLRLPTTWRRARSSRGSSTAGRRCRRASTTSPIWCSTRSRPRSASQASCTASRRHSRRRPG